jgi:hypothetical protein
MPLPDNTTEATALDTSGDGQLSPDDSPFSPYYPGDEYVDWVGLSVYYKGPNSRNLNAIQPNGYCYGALRNHNPNNGVDTVDPWYENYCEGRNKACMVSLVSSFSFNLIPLPYFSKLNSVLPSSLRHTCHRQPKVRRIWSCLS